ncbi:MAG TPA: GNAT family N-acetyltransferase [Ktedonobacteraceae bacterium]|jgi:ribosomal protein S18 acetylase RimI-like enzyme|nr:GNAT family N-acetyltransferase [Ktedonobacteraceae bacterium]
MKETPEDIERLQALLDHSIERAGTFLRRSFQMPEHSLTASELIDCWQDVRTVALATVTTKGEPRVAPIGSLLYRGDIYIPTVATAARTRHIQKRPAVSLTLFHENGLAIIVHGSATVITPDHEDFETLENLLYASTHTKAGEWGDGVYLRIEADAIYTYSRHPHRPLESLDLQITPLTSEDSAWVRQFIIEHWGDAIVVAHGKVYQPETLPGFVAVLKGNRVGLLTYSLEGESCEIVTLDSTKPGVGIGTLLIEAAARVAREAGCKRLWLITTNDNLHALRFYQKRGFRLVAVHRNAVDASRQLKPAIPLTGNDQIPIHDEIELEILL